MSFQAPPSFGMGMHVTHGPKVAVPPVWQLIIQDRRLFCTGNHMNSSAIWEIIA